MPLMNKSRSGIESGWAPYRPILHPLPEVAYGQSAQCVIPGICNLTLLQNPWTGAHTTLEATALIQALVVHLSWASKGVEAAL